MLSWAANNTKKLGGQPPGSLECCEWQTPECCLPWAAFSCMCGVRVLSQRRVVRCTVYQAASEDLSVTRDQASRLIMGLTCLGSHHLPGTCYVCLQGGARVSYTAPLHRDTVVTQSRLHRLTLQPLCTYTFSLLPNTPTLLLPHDATHRDADATPHHSTPCAQGR